MALTQSARLPGPSWDEEVVPALRKRLESESRTLARRMSAISLSSLDESPNFSALSESNTRERPAPTSPFLQSNASNSRSHQQESRSSSDRTIPSSSSHVNGTQKKKPPSPSFQRSRTYSQPYLSDLPNGKTNVASRSKANGTRTPVDMSRSLSPRPTDVKPTRIPKASRGPTGSSSNHGHSSPIPNGNGYHFPPPDLYQTPDLHVVQETMSVNSSRSNVAIPNRQNPYILNEPAPFKPGSISSVTPSHYESPEEARPRASNDSEERPFEHWYRGEVSRNGGVGELRVGRRQEMLEIANYGHTIRTKAANSRAAVPNVIDDGRQRRKRADSVSGIEAKVRDRGSLYLDDEHAREIGRVLDEGPPTDLDDDEGSDVGSASEHYMAAHRNYNFMSDVGDMSTVSAPVPQSTYDVRSTTPTSPIMRPSSRQQNLPPTRIPAPPSRQSSESRVPTPTQMSRGPSEPPPVPSTSAAAAPPAVRQRQPSKPTPVAAKRGASPASTATSKKSRTAASKATRAKTMASRKEMEAEANRRSVAYYPTPADDELMMDAIPSWTQPVPKQGNWDEVVLPVVARKKGLDGHYEQADGSPQPKKVNNAIEPAPGTFGFDHSKYRPPRGDPEMIPMDEFGRPSTRIADEPEHDHHDRNLSQSTNAHDETRLPVRQPPPPSPAPFSDYAPTSEKTVPTVHAGRHPEDVEQGRQEEEDDDKGAGCCKCVIM